MLNCRHPDPRRVLGRCRAAVRGQDPADPLDPRDPRDPGMGSFFRVLGITNNEHENPNSQLSILLCFLLVFVIDFSFSLCFATNLYAFLLNSCSGGPRRLSRSGSALWRSSGRPWESSGRLYIYTKIPDQPHQRPLCQ